MFGFLCSMIMSTTVMADKLAGNYELHQPGITYQIQLTHADNGQIQGVLNSTLVSLPIMGEVDGCEAKGDLIGFGNLGFEAKIEDGKLQFDILQKDTEGSKRTKRLELLRMSDPAGIKNLNESAKEAAKVLKMRNIEQSAEQNQHKGSREPQK